MAIKKRNKKKLPALKFWQKLLLLGFSFLLILGGEGILRWRGYGGYFPLFIPLYQFPDGRQILGTNPRAQILFFLSRTESGGRLMGYMNREIMLTPKSRKALRILFVGESTVQGYPHSRTLCSPAFLMMMLNDSLPEKDIEVINLGITAVASYPVWKITQQALDYEPDLVIVYTGHNEYFGAFGVASLQSVGLSTFKMNSIYWLRGLSIYQFLAKWIEKFHKKYDTTSDIQGNLLEIMAKTENIPVHNKLRKQALKNLENHLRIIIRECKKTKIPVVICTLVSNERNMAPLRSPDPKILTPNQKNVWQSNYEKGFKELKDNSSGSVHYLKQAVETFPSHALTHYHYAQALEQSGDTSGAVNEYKRARDLDEMPWRAAETTNVLIRNLVQEEKVWLADVEKSFLDEEPLGNGWRFISDHLHPSLEGQVLLARTIYNTLSTHHWASLDQSNIPMEFDWEKIAMKHGNNRMEEYKIAALMASLWNNPPFVNNNENAAERFLKIMFEIESNSPSPEKKAMEKGKKIWLEKGKPPDYSLLAAEEYIDSRNPKQALHYYQSSWLQTDDLTVRKLSTAVNMLSCAQLLQGGLNTGEKEFANKNLEDSELLEKIGVSPKEKGEYYRDCGFLYQMLGKYSEAINYFQKSLPYYKEKTRQQIAIRMAQSFLAMHQPDNARKILREEQNSGPWDGPKQMLNELNSIDTSE